MLRAALVGGQKSVEELVDRQQLRNTNVRNLLVDYLRRRAADLDHSSLRQLARVLPGTFWSNVEKAAASRVPWPTVVITVRASPLLM